MTTALAEKEKQDAASVNGDMHTLSVFVANKPGVLARIAQVFARRGFNIDSLVVSASMDGKYSRMTITALGDPENLDQIIMQVSKLVDVIHCIDHSDDNAVVRELALIKVSAEPSGANRNPSNRRTLWMQDGGFDGKISHCDGIWRFREN